MKAEERKEPGGRPMGVPQAALPRPAQPPLLVIFLGPQVPDMGRGQSPEITERDKPSPGPPGRAWGSAVHRRAFLE